MKTLKEQYGLETKFTQHLATDIGIDDLNKINNLLGLPSVISARNEYPITGGSIDVIGYTVKGDVIVYEHQALPGKADQTHVGKTSHYARVMKSNGHKVLGAILLCESIDDIFLETFKDIRESYVRRKYNGHCNIHAVKSQWTDTGEYVPELFEDTEFNPAKESSLNLYKDFYKVYAKDWAIQREGTNGDAITLWHRLSELPNKYMAYVHTLKNSIKVGLHCEKDYTLEDEEFLKKVCPQGWEYRNTAKERRTIELTLPLNSSQEQWADETEKLKRKVRASL